MSLLNHLLGAGNRISQGQGSMTSRPGRSIPNETPEIHEPEFRTCDICALTMGSAHYPSDAFLPDPCSTHCSTICKLCISQSLAADIETKSIEHIGCPSCDHPWDRSVIEIHVPPKTLAEYDSRNILRVLEALPDFRRCQSPICGNGQLHVGGDAEPMITCSECSFRSCYRHKVAWHIRISCEEFDAMTQDEVEEMERKRVKLEEAQYQEVYGKEAKPCPKCKASILKDGGCSSMRCTCICLHNKAKISVGIANKTIGTKCSFRFCWLCSAKQRKLQDHNPGCPLYRVRDFALLIAPVVDVRLPEIPVLATERERDPHVMPRAHSIRRLFSSAKNREASTTNSTTAAVQTFDRPSAADSDRTLRGRGSNTSSHPSPSPSSANSTTNLLVSHGDVFASSSKSKLASNPMLLDWDNFCYPCGTITGDCGHKKGKGREIQ